MYALLLFVSIVTFLYLWLNIAYGYWKRRNVAGPVPTLLGGNISDAMKGKKSLGDVYYEIYRKYKYYPFVGIYKSFTPALLLIDIDVLKTVLIKDFNSFGENTLGFSIKSPLLAKNPFVLNLEQWKPSRQQLASLLSSLKLKSAITVFRNSAQNMVNYIHKEIDSSKNSTITVEAKLFSVRYTTSNVASWGLGIEAGCFTSTPSEFFDVIKQIFQLTFFQNISFLIMLIFPRLGPFLDTNIISRSAEKRIVSIIRESIQHRINSKVDRNDYLGALLSLKNASNLTDKEIISHVGSLCIDGIETSSVILHFLLYELAANPDIQEIVRKEVDDALKTDSEEETLTFESIQAMKYLDAVLNETLRLHLVLPFLEKRTTRRCTLSGRTQNGQELELTLEKGTAIVVPLLGLHMDESYFPDPSSFKPERFLGKNKENIPKCSFMPFGEGPRTCVGKMFGTYQVKTAAIYLTRNFKISLGDKTPYPIEIDPTKLFSLPKEPIKIKFTSRI